MRKYVRTRFSLDEETDRMLDIFCENNKMNRLKLIRYLILHFDQAPYKLRSILIETNRMLAIRKANEIWKKKIDEEWLKE